MPADMAMHQAFPGCTRGASPWDKFPARRMVSRFIEEMCLVMRGIGIGRIVFCRDRSITGSAASSRPISIVRESHDGIEPPVVMKMLFQVIEKGEGFRLPTPCGR